MTPIKTLICYADTNKRLSITTFLKSDSRFEAVDGFSCGKQAVAKKARTLRPDVVILSLNLPDMCGLEATRRLVAAFPDAKVIVYSSNDDEELVIQAIRAGATGNLSPDASPAIVADTIFEVSKGSYPLSPNVCRRLVHSLHQPTPQYGLFGQELEVLRLLVEGKRIKEIASIITRGKDCANKKLHAIYKKLGVRTGKQAVAKAVREGLV